MAYALVGSIGTAVQGAASAAVNPTFGQATTANNLLILFTSVTGVATQPATPSGWTVFGNAFGTSCNICLFYKLAAGSDTAPTVAAVTSGVIAAQLAEFSGNPASSFTDRPGTGTVGTTSPITDTCQVGADATTGELLIILTADFRSVARTTSDTLTSNHGTVTAAGNNNGASSVNHYSFGYVLGTTSNVGADTATMTLSVTTSITGLAIVCSSFKLPPQVMCEFVQQPIVPGQDAVLWQ